MKIAGIDIPEDVRAEVLESVKESLIPYNHSTETVDMILKGIDGEYGEEVATMTLEVMNYL